MATLAGTAAPAASAAGPGRLTRFFRYARRNPAFGIGLIILITLVLFSTVGMLFIDLRKAPYPLGTPPSKPPSWQYPFGTDAQGRNLIAVMIVGTQLTLRVGLMAGAIGIAVGTILGFVSAYYGGFLDGVVKWIVDVMLPSPAFLILVVIASTLRNFLTVESMALIIAVLAWVGPTRMIRAQVLTLRERQFVLMARLSGMNNIEIMFKELLPNVLPYLLAGFVQSVTAAILTALGLELLGLGSQREPTLGMTIYWVQKYSAILRGLWWWWTIPVIIIVLLVVSLALISLGLDEWSNPRTRRAA
jgi:peptide/nickel transport system permease protein